MCEGCYSDVCLLFRSRFPELGMLEYKDYQIFRVLQAYMGVGLGVLEGLEVVGFAVFLWVGVLGGRLA